MTHYLLENGKLVRNRLYHVNDAIAGATYVGDLEDQGLYIDTSHFAIENHNNYLYDAEGRLIQDLAEGIQEIVWRVDGKVKKVNFTSTSGKNNLEFDYDAFGRRIAKHVHDQQGLLVKSTYYILDASGNQLLTYEHVVDNEESNYQITERVIYGSSRLGLNTNKVDMLDENPEEILSLTLGNKLYEMSNHLGNVLTVINDIKVPQATNSVDVDGYLATIVSTADYSPFGVQLDGRTESAESYRYGFNGMEKDDELKGAGNSYDFGARIYDSRLGRFLSRDPHFRNYPDISSYVFVNNMPIWAIDPDGKDIIVLSAPSGANGAGHAAVLIGNDKDGWKYYSKNGTEEHGSKGDSYNPNNGDHFASIQDFANSSSNFINGEQYYTSAYRISASTEIDMKMEKAASEAVNSCYHLTGSSCADVSTVALDAGGFYAAIDPWNSTLPEVTDIPKVRYWLERRVNKKLHGAKDVSINPSAEVKELERKVNLPDFEFKTVDAGTKYGSADKTRVYNPVLIIDKDNREIKRIATEKLEKIRNPDEKK